MNALAHYNRSASGKKRPRRDVCVRINKAFLALYDLRCRYIVVYGGRRSSKSWSVSQLLVRRAAENPGRKIIVMRKVATTLRLSVWPRILNALEEAGLLQDCDINKTEKVIVLPNGSTFEFVGADDPQKLKSLEGATDYWLEEANEFDEIDLDTIDAGLSNEQPWPCQVWLTFNPVPVLANYVPWIAARFVNKITHTLGVVKVEGNVAILRAWYKNNACCPKATVDLLEGYAKTNPDLYKLWALGEYTYLEGVIFKNWDVVDHAPAGVHDRGYGLDFGFTVDPSALVHVWTRELPDGRQEVWAREELYETDLNNFALGRRMRELGVSPTADIIADSSEPKSIDEICSMGFNVYPATKGPDSVRSGLQQMQSMVIHLLRGSTNLEREFATYCWKKNKDGKELPEPVDANNHAIDAFRYRVVQRAQAAACSLL